MRANCLPFRPLTSRQIQSPSALNRGRIARRVRELCLHHQHKSSTKYLRLPLSGSLLGNNAENSRSAAPLAWPGLARAKSRKSSYHTPSRSTLRRFPAPYPLAACDPGGRWAYVESLRCNLRTAHRLPAKARDASALPPWSRVRDACNRSWIL